MKKAIIGILIGFIWGVCFVFVLLGTGNSTNIKVGSHYWRRVYSKKQLFAPIDTLSPTPNLK